MFDPNEQQAIEATLRRFAAKADRLLFATQDPDGSLAHIPSLLAEARDMGILADPLPGSAGHELGVWGQGCHTEGLKRSLLTLAILGEACAGFATAIHAQGLACLALGESSLVAPGTTLAAAFTLDYGIPLGTRLEPEDSGLQWVDVEGDLQLNGTAHFVLAAEVPDKLICFARRTITGKPEPEWVSLLLDAQTPGVEMIEVAHRTGLRAARQYHLHCNQARVTRERLLDTGETARRSLAQVMACDWLGQAAIALGAARRSLRDSRQYTAQRYQGGRIIEAHASIQLLQGTAEYDIATMTAILDQHADEPLASPTPVLLRWAAQAKLAIAEHAHRAVTHGLQTLGGYGYMQDYGFEKRLRDVSVLKSLHGTPDQLRLFLNQLAREEQ